MLNTHKESLKEDDEDDDDNEDEEDNNDKIDDDGGDYHNDMPGLQDDDDTFVTQDTYEYNFVFPNEMLGLELTRGRRKGVRVSKVNIGELKHSIHIKDTVIAVNNERVGNDLSALRSSKQPVCIQFSRTVSTIRRMEEETVAREPGQQEIEDEIADKEYNINEECMSGGDIPKGTGVNNSNVESMTTNETEKMEITETDVETSQWDQLRRNY